MKHSQYKHWILDKEALDADQKKSLSQHLSACKECRQLKSGWDASQKILASAIIASPSHGFANRWNATFIRKIKQEKVRRYRLTVVGLLVLGFLSSLIYMAASGSFLHVLANSFTAITQIVIAITHGLSTIGYWISRLHIAVPLAAGFLLFGLLTAFLMATAFAFWNINNRKKTAYEIASN